MVTVVSLPDLRECARHNVMNRRVLGGLGSRSSRVEVAM